MTERFPEQRNRSAQRRADAPRVPASGPDIAAPVDEPLPVFDDAFVAAARVREPSAQARALLARRAPNPSPDPAAEYRFFEQALRRWSVRPSHHLSALRLPAVAAVTTCVLAATALLLLLLR